MSPKSRGRRPQHKPHAKRDPRREKARVARQTMPAELLTTMLSAGKDIVRADGPFEAETIAGSLVGTWWGGELIDADVDEVIGEAIVEEAARQRTPESLALLSAMAAVTHGRLAIKATSAADTLDRQGALPPTWRPQIGKPDPVACYRTWDTTGDGFNVISLFAYDGEPAHAVLVYIDRNLGGLAKDAWAVAEGEELVSRFRAACRTDDGMQMDTLDPADARALVERAFAVTERALPYDPPVSDEARSNRALALARMRLLPEHPRPQEVVAPEDDVLRGDGYDQERRRFLATPSVKAWGVLGSWGTASTRSSTTATSTTTDASCGSAQSRWRSYSTTGCRTGLSSLCQRSVSCRRYSNSGVVMRPRVRICRRPRLWKRSPVSTGSGLASRKRRGQLTSPNSPSSVSM